VSNDVLGMYEALHKRGFDVRLLPSDHALALGLNVIGPEDVANFLSRKQDIFIYHYAVHWPLAENLLQQLKCRRIIKYHNITPAEFFIDIDKAHYEACHIGRQSLPRIAKLADEVWGDSDYNLREFIDQGFPIDRMRTIAPFHQTGQLLNLAPDRQWSARIEAKPSIVCVGRLAPNKNHGLLIRAFNEVLKTKPDAQLVFIGGRDQRLAPYLKQLDALVASSPVPQAIVFAGGLDGHGLAAAYRSARLFAITSLHEGFCVPLIEAMAFHLPVLSLNRAAIPQTIGEAGLVIDDEDPLVIAQAILRLLDEQSTQDRLTHLGARRYQDEFSTQAIEQKFINAIYARLVPKERNITSVHQFHSGTAIGDAITNAMFLIRDMLRSYGLTSEIYAEHIALELTQEIKPHHELMLDESSLLLLHHSMGNDLESWVAALNGKICLVYHNITPAEFFAPGTDLRHYAAKGRAQLIDYRNYCSAALADSQTNAEELLQAGYQNIEAIPLLFDLEARKSAPFNHQLLSREARCLTILFVGRVTRHKCQREFIPLALALKKILPLPFQIVLVGGAQQNDAYCEEIKADIEAFDLEDVVRLTGKIADQDLLAWYRIAKIFVCLSEHEGFGIPLIEAMSFEIPVIAFNSSAIAETMGGAGLLIHDKNPNLVAALIKSLIYDKPLQRALIASQTRRIQDFARPQIEARFRSALTHLGVALSCAPKQSLSKIDEQKAPARLQIEGPIETSYSLAIVNRELARALEEIQQDFVSLYATEGPGDYEIDRDRIAQIDWLENLWQRGDQTTKHDLVIRNLYPPRVIDMRGRMNILNYAWEESGFPLDWIEDFNATLDGVSVTSRFVKKVLIDNGLTIPCAVIGNGIDHIGRITPFAYKGPLGSGFRFLHVSSCFPRKGVDVLLEAFANAFSKKDDVTLIIKTFANPHNTIEEQITRIKKKHPDCPPIILINDDLPEGQILDLYSQCHALVAPSRGEGFGLPMAEAMYLGLPVITTALGGQTDFCTNETCWLIDFDFGKADSHLGLADSVWAEPNVESLIAQMRKIHHAEPGEITRKTDQARQLMIDKFKWADSAARLQDFRASLAHAKPLARRRLKLGWISSWNTKCGIANYSQFLLDMLDEDQFETTILASRSQILGPDQSHVERLWTNQFEYAEELIRRLDTADFDIIMIQFNFSFFSLESLRNIIRLCQRRKIVCVLTLHSTADVKAPGYETSLRDVLTELALVTRILVHSIADLNRLKSWGLIENVTLLPHGVITAEPLSKDIARKPLALPLSAKVIATYGFMLPHKGLVEIVEAMPFIIAKYPEAKLIMANALYPDPVSEALLQTIKTRISALGLEQHISLHTDFLEDVDSLALLAAADCTIFPYQKTAESSSAAVRFGLASQRPVFCTPLAIFSDVAEAVNFTSGTDPQDLAQDLIAYFNTPQRYAAITQRQSEWLASHAFSTISRRLGNMLTGLNVDLHKD
jgi:glycosyltransferase involved in cell wall biosynthesis